MNYRIVKSWLIGMLAGSVAECKALEEVAALYAKSMGTIYTISGGASYRVVIVEKLV